MAEVPQDSFDGALEGTPDEPLEGGEPEPKEPEPKQPEHIPWDRFQEVYQDRQRLAAEVEQQRNLLWQQGQTLQNAWQQRQAPPAEPEDPQLAEVEKIIAPLIDKRLAPMQQRYQQTMMVLEAQSEAQQALQFFESNVPDHKELQPDFLKYLDTLDPAMRARVFQDPRFAVMTANAVRGMRDSGQLKANSQAKEAVRGRAKSESGGNSPSLNSQQAVDYNSMSDEDFAKMDALIARRRRS